MAWPRKARPSRPAAQASALHVAATTAHGIGVLTAAGELDLDSSGLLQEALSRAATAQPRIALDLHELTFMDSTGINVLLAAHQLLTRTGGWLRLAAPTDTVLRTLRLVGLDTILDCRTTLHYALTP